MQSPHRNHPFCFSTWRAGALALALLTMTAQAPAQDKAAGQVDCGFTAAEVFANASPGVVQVFSLGIDQFRVVERVRAAQGSGFLLRDDLVVTNYHVIAQAQTIGVAISNQFLDARVVGSDPILDIAVLQAPALGFFTKKLELAPANEITVGQPAYVLGYPLGIGKSISAGIVSGLERIVPLNTSSWLSPSPDRMPMLRASQL